MGTQMALMLALFFHRFNDLYLRDETMKKRKKQQQHKT